MSLEKSIKVNCFIKKTKLLKNGEAPIFIRIIIGRERDEFGVKKSVLPKYWENDQQIVKTNCEKAVLINPLLVEYRNRIQTYYDVMRMDKQTVTPRILKERIVGKKENKRTILQIFQEHNDNARKLIEIDFAEDTVKRYETTYKHTKNFIKWQYNREDIPLEELNQYFIDKFELYLKTERNCAHNSAIKYLKNFKKIVRIALANNWMENDPFANIKFKLKPVEPVYLTEDELMRIINKKMTIKRIEQVRDAFVFCCFTGLAFSDVKTLKLEHFTLDKEIDTWINKDRVKTGQKSTILVLDAAKRLLEKYKDNPEANRKGTMLPLLCNQKMNQYLKEIADICGIKKNLTTHTARHTFATTVMLENDVPIEVVSKALGHSNIKITQHYARTTQKLIKNNMKKIAHLY